MKNISFTVREYGRTELAQAYSPETTPPAAWRRLRQWICYHPTLLQQLTATGYHTHQRVFTPIQVKLIVQELGEP